MEAVRLSATNIPPQPMEERPQPPEMVRRFQQATPTPASVLPSMKAKADETDLSLIKKLAGLEAEKVLSDKALTGGDKSFEELERAVERAKRNAIGMRIKMGEPSTQTFPRIYPVIKPSDIKKSVLEDKKFFGSTTGFRNLLPSQGGRIGTNWDASLRRMG